ncbi:hypothetical protein JN535_16650 [Cellulosimicrobium cellulans]|uniref:hypothetical protein n=1 Tax=Cellulosimicrobium cellulans TaxID=1710 RepID=UPI001965733B|nr:hypothetical protein [Cellulosimicrobium cellulans]MBN0041792.1 hypothetical protein [Cellulosimicrobium cellulans]
MRTTTAAVVIPAVLGLLVVAGCATTGTPAPADDASTSPGADVVGEAAPPSAFVNRDPLDSCGDLRLDQGESVPDDAYRCLDDAAATGAELVVTLPTTEGDPIVNYYRVGPGIEGLEIFVDATRDTYGSGQWAHLRCPAAESASEPGECRAA